MSMRVGIEGYLLTEFYKALSNNNKINRISPVATRRIVYSQLFQKTDIFRGPYDIK